MSLLLQLDAKLRTADVFSAYKLHAVERRAHPHFPLPAAAAWVERHRESITASLQQHSGLHSVVWRQAADMLKEEGCGVDGSGSGSNGVSQGQAAAAAAAGTGTEAGAEEEEGSAVEEGSEAGGSSKTVGSGEALAAAMAQAVVASENGLKYAALPLAGQKTGFYADQRESRLLVSAGGQGLSCDVACGRPTPSI